MYGALQGLNKSETAALHGEAQVKLWRRSYDIPPPALETSSPMYPGTDPKYAVGCLMLYYFSGLMINYVVYQSLYSVVNNNNNDNNTYLFISYT